MHRGAERPGVGVLSPGEALARRAHPGAQRAIPGLIETPLLAAGEAVTRSCSGLQQNGATWATGPAALRERAKYRAFVHRLSRVQVSGTEA